MDSGVAAWQIGQWCGSLANRYGGGMVRLLKNFNPRICCKPIACPFIF